MIAYFDTSAVIPLLVTEPTSDAVAEWWMRASRVVSVRLLYPEARAALARAHREGRLTGQQHRITVSELARLDAQLDHVEVTGHLAARAGDLAEQEALRGYDAVHLAAAETIADDDVVLVTGDRTLRVAAHHVGIATAVLL